MTNTLNWLKDLLRTALYLTALGFLIWNLPTIATAGHTLLERAGALNTLEVAGVKIGFDQASVFQQLDYPHLSAADKTKVLEKLEGLEPDEFERLMNVGELADLCEFEQPNVEMRRMIALDYQLREKGLTFIVDSPDLRTNVEAKIKVGEAESHKPSDIGHPRACYVMDLTATGHDAKTALVKLLSNAFNPRVAMK